MKWCRLKKSASQEKCAGGSAGNSLTFRQMVEHFWLRVKLIKMYKSNYNANYCLLYLMTDILVSAVEKINYFWILWMFL